jgi:hypothetical protein
MKIENDAVSFDAADFDGLSDFAKKALPIYVGENLEFQNVLASDINKVVESAKENLIRTTRSSDEVNPLLRKLAAADSATQAQAIAAIKNVLDPVVAPSPINFLPAGLTPGLQGGIGSK